MSRLIYFLTTFAEAGLAIFGIRGAYEQPHYRVVQTLSAGIEIRAYDGRVAVETSMRDGEGAAFGRLFRYITGANMTRQTVAMTTPVEEHPQRIAMTVPVERSAGSATMRFFLPAAVVAAGVPTPTDKDVSIVHLAAVTLGVVRYSGTASAAARAAEEGRLRDALTRAGRTPQGDATYLSYDPPFTIPFLRRNEVALPVGS